MSSQWSYGPDGLRPKPPASRWGLAADWLRWRDLQPLLLRSAGVVGLAGLTIALISSNAFVGSKPRASVTPAVVSAVSELSGARVDDAVIAAPESTGAIPRVEPVALSLPSETELPQPAEPRPIALQPQTTGRQMSPVPFAPAAQELPATPDAPSAPRQAATLDAAIAPPASPLPLAEVNAPPAVDASSAGNTVPVQVASIDPEEMQGRTNPTWERMSAVWEEEAVICPRDWVVAIDANGAGDESCQPIGTVIASLEADDIALRSAIEERAEQVAALTPRMPEPRPIVATEDAANAAVDAPQDTAEESAEPDPPAKVQKKSKARRVSARKSDWPAAAPPDCGPGKRAKWRFTNRSTGAKEWYCR